jgi:hypothetical protein
MGLPTVRLVRGKEEMDSHDILANASQIQAEIHLDKAASPKKWDVVVVNEDGQSERLPDAFEIT